MDKQQFMDDLGSQASFCAEPLSIPALVLHHARVRPTTTALTCVRRGGAESLTYEELAKEAAHVAAVLGDAQGRPMALLAEDVLDFVVGFLAIGMAGGIPVPMAPELLTAGDSHLDRVLADSTATLVLASGDAVLTAAQAAGAEALALVRPSRGERQAVDPALVAESSDVAFLQYTSGSTGTPKGVIVRHRNLFSNVELIRSAFRFHADSVMGSWLPPHHDMGLIGGILTPLCLGSPTVLMSPADFVRDPAQWLRMIDRYGVTISGGPNFAYDLCLRRVRNEDTAGLDLSRWEVAFNGAETVRLKTLTAFEERFAPAGFKPDRWAPCYGLAEATLFVAGSAEGQAQVAHEGAGSDDDVPVVGCRLLPDAHVAIIDMASITELPAGSVGEIWVQGDSVAAGYWRDPARTAENFGARLRGRKGTWLRTGDLGRRWGDYLYVRGRVKDLIVLRGRNHYPEDVEATVRATVAGRCAVFGVDDGFEEHAVALYEAKDTISEAEISDTVRAAVTARHGITLGDVRRVDPRSIPVTTSGKVQRLACARLYSEGRWSIDSGALRPLASINDSLLAELAVVALERAVNGAKSLVSQGLDSVRATHMRGLIEDHTGVRVSIATLLSDLPLSDLAAHVKPATNDHMPERHTKPEGARLTSGQEAIWLQNSLADAPGNCNLGRALRLRGDVDRHRIERVLEMIVARHEALRLCFDVQRGSHYVIQQPAPAQPSQLECFGGRIWGEREADGSIRHMVSAPFDLRSGPPFRAALYSLDDGSHLLVLMAHHLVADAWSLSLIIEDLRRGLTAPELLSHRAGSFVDLVQHRGTGTAETRKCEEPDVALPGVMHVDPSRRSFRGESTARDLPAGTAERLRVQAADLGVTLPSLLFAAYARALGSVSGQKSLRLGWISDGRSEAAAEDIVGYCVALNVVPVVLSDDRSQDVRQLAASLLDHRHSAGPDRAQQVSAVYAYQQVSVNGHLKLAPILMNRAASMGDWNGVQVECVPTQHSSSYFPLALYVAEHEGGLFVTWERGIDEIPQATVDLVADAFERELQHFDNLGTEPEIQTSAGVAGGRIPTVEGLSTPSLPCIHDLIAETARRNPDAVALIGNGGKMTYAEMESAANQLAHALVTAGVEPASHVGICLPRSSMSVIAVLAVLKTGGTYVPLDPHYPRNRLSYIIDDASIDTVIVDESTTALLEAINKIHVMGEGVLEQPTARPKVRVLPDDAAYLVYTSGSTGAPNGVVGLHRGIVNRNLDMQARYPMTAQDVGSHKTSLNYFDSGGEIFWPLMSGVPLVVVPEDTGRDPHALVRLLSDEKVTRLVAVPALLRAILDSAPDAARHLRNLRFVHSSGEALSQQLASDLLDTVPKATIINLYGCSEVSADVSLHELRPERPVTLGRVMAGVTIYVLDDELRKVPLGGSGHIHVGGEPLARGYHDRPALTADRFVPNPYGVPGERLFRTGDLGRWNTDGELEFLGRADHQVKVRGHRVELGEVEHYLVNHPQVVDAAVALRSTEDGVRLVAMVVPNAASTDSDERVRAWQGLYDDMYSSLTDDRRKQETAWTDSYTGAPFSSNVMDAWIDSAVARVNAWSPSSVLEIGCGTGNLLLPLAFGRRCVGTDFSAPVLGYLRSVLDDWGPDYVHVDLVHAPADRLSFLDEEQFDAVVMHSVVQYLPDEAYLRRAIEGAIAHVAPGGHLLIGDARDLSLLEDFHRHRLVARGRPHDDPSVAAAVAADQELVVERALFVEIARGQRFDCDVHVKRMADVNELSRFRFDVVMSRPNLRSETSMSEPMTLSAPSSVAALRMELARAARRPVVVEHVLNARLDGVVDMRSRQPVFDPESLRLLGESLGRQTDVLISPADRSAALTVRYEIPGRPAGYSRWPRPEPSRPVQLTNSSGGDTATQSLVDNVRRHLRDRLPDFMIPTVTLVSELPRTVNGKIDRVAVARVTDRVTGAPTAQSRGGADGLHAQVAQTWREVLGVEDVASDTNFFDAGGNSLSLVRVHLRLQTIAKVEFPLVDLYEHVTIATHASHLVDLQAQLLFDRNDPDDSEATPLAEPATQSKLRERSAGRRQELRRRHGPSNA